MFLCESLLMTIIVMLGAYVTYTDIKSGIIQNRVLLVATIIGIIINTVYLGFFCREYLGVYTINIIVMTLLAIALYGFHFWAAGDSKLLICINLLFPARFYFLNKFSFAPGMNAVVLMFLFAYMFLIVDSIVMLIKRKEFYSGFGSKKKKIKKFIINLVLGFIYLRALNELLVIVLGDYYSDNRLLFSFLSIFVSLFIYDKEVFKKIYMIIPIVILNCALWVMRPYHNVEVFSYVVLFFALLLRYLLNGYNYQEIETQNVTKGMVLAYSTVLGFMTSKVKGLPEVTYEDMRSRLTEEQAEAIKRWGVSKSGKERIVIVRKIPFAVFIVLGELAFFFVRLRGF